MFRVNYITAKVVNISVGENNSAETGKISSNSALIYGNAVRFVY